MFTIMAPLLKQLKKRRLDLKLKQKDMMLRIGISRQQYQRLEARGNPRLDTLELIAKGLNSELMLIPQEKLSAVKSVLQNDISEQSKKPAHRSKEKENKSLSEDPWQDLLEEDQ
jgi:transcriptional regulator with XRE-family HTH domain